MHIIARRLLSSASISMLVAIVLFTSSAPGVSSVSAASPATDRESPWTQHCRAWERITHGITVCRDMEHFTATFSRNVLGSPGGALDKALVALLP